MYVDYVLIMSIDATNNGLLRLSAVTWKGLLLYRVCIDDLTVMCVCETFASFQAKKVT